MGTTYYSLETSNISVSGWKMANVSNTSIKAYIDNTEIDSKKINYVERPDVIQSITGYGTQEENPRPGFNFNIDINSLESGNHIIKIELCAGDTILQTENLTITID